MTDTKAEGQTTRKKPLLLRLPTGAVLAVLLAVGLGYGFWYLHLIHSSKMCAPETGFVGPHAPSFVSCLNINEIGDALGGAFGPLAFLFLAGALLIQSMELAAQRWELDETQEVMREQVAEMRASTALLKEQTDVVKQEQKLRDMQQSDREFEEMADNFRDFIRSDGAFSFSCVIRENTGVLGMTGTIKNVTVFGFASDVQATAYDIFFEASREATDALPILRNPNCMIDLGSWDQHKLDIIRIDLLELEKKQSHLSGPYKIKSQRMRISYILDALNELERLWRKAEQNRVNQA